MNYYDNDIPVIEQVIETALKVLAVITTALILMLIVSCGNDPKKIGFDSKQTTPTGQDWDEEVFESPPIIVHVAGSTEYLADGLLIERGWTAAAFKPNHIYVKAYKDKEGYIFFEDTCKAGHELQHIMNFAYPDYWYSHDPN